MQLTVSSNSRFAARALAVTLACAMASPARSATALEISVLEGRDARNLIGSPNSNSASVQVRAEGKPVRGARVRFQLPEFGPSGAFSDGSRDAVAFTDERGVAYMAAFKPNAIEGRFTVVVDANYAGLATSSAVPQSNVASISKMRERTTAAPQAKSSHSNSKLLLVLGIGAAAALGGAFATRGGGSKGAPTTVSVGGVGVGGGN
ncbi:MAG: hypothetical protein U0Q16_31630 [Bryobacteraceae bacterium]